MMASEKNLTLIATCMFGLEAVVVRELLALGYLDAKSKGSGRVEFSGDYLAIARANMWLRCADRVLIKVGAFRADDFGQLFDGVKSLPWEEWITKDSQFPVKGRSYKSQLSSVPACQKMVKKAVVERLKGVYHIEWFEEPQSGGKCVIEVAMRDDVATLTIDTSGEGLHKRGYRVLAGAAPLRETLAAGLVSLSFWEDGRMLVDPFCGSGTIAIEAALIGRNIAPGLNRRFAADDWPMIGDEIWEEALTQARDVQKKKLEVKIAGYDIDGDVLDLARHHTKLAGVEGDIHWQERAFEDLGGKSEYGVMVTNPPYGRRIGVGVGGGGEGDWADVGALYASMPDVLRRLETWSHFILTAYPRFEEVIGQEADRRRKLYNARIECTYFQFHGPRPEKLQREKDIPEQGESKKQTLAVFGGVSEKSKEDAEVFGNRLKKTARHMRKWESKRGISCYRLYDRDVPVVPLVVDYYEGCLHIGEYERPHDRNAGEQGAWLELMGKKAGEVLGVQWDNVYIKSRMRQRGKEQHEKTDQAKRMKVVSEGGLKFLVNLSDYIDTGLFLDHRLTRQMVKEESQGKDVLNLFGYTGSFSVYAAAGGAKSTMTVDLSAKYLDWAEENLAINGFEGDSHMLVRGDVLEVLGDFIEGGEKFDLIVVDPPTFSNSKRTDHDWEVGKDHVLLMERVKMLLDVGGVCYFSNNFRKFKMDAEALAGFEVEEISEKTVPEDFRNKRVHRCWRLVKK